MNVLSLFDGISAGQLALQRADIPATSYYASEIDKYAISITQKNFPSTIQLGDINNWENWHLPSIDFIFAGFCCQSYSSAGLGLGLDDVRGQLIFPMLKIIGHYKPKHFLLENVKGFISKKHKSVFDMLVSELEDYGYSVYSDIINSSLVSAQSRERIYITNFKFTQPKDEHIYLKDIIESGDVDRDKSYCIDANYFKGGSLKSYYESCRRQIVYLPEYQSEKLLMVKDKSQTILSTIYKENEKSMVKRNKFGLVIGTETNKNISFRKLTPLECERLQTFSDKYTEGISNTQRYKCLGNSWTVDVVSHILSCI